MTATQKRSRGITGRVEHRTGTLIASLSAGQTAIKNLGTVADFVFHPGGGGGVKVNEWWGGGHRDVGERQNGGRVQVYGVDINNGFKNSAISCLARLFAPSVLCGNTWILRAVTTAFAFSGSTNFIK